MKCIKIYTIVSILILLTGCSQKLGADLTPIQQEILDKPWLQLKATKDKILKSTEKTVYYKKLVSDITTTTPQYILISEGIVEYDYISSVKLTGEYIFNGREFSNAKTVKHTGNSKTTNFYFRDWFYKDSNNEVYKIEKNATTTVAAWNEQTKLTLLDKVKELFGKKATAATNYDVDMTNSRILTVVGSTSWNDTHDRTTADTSAAFTANIQNPLWYGGVHDGGTNYYLRRNELVFNTSGIGAGQQVTAADLYFYYDYVAGFDDNGYNIVVLDNTNNAGLSHPLATEDYNDFGTASINGSKSITSLGTTDALASTTLTSFTAINMTGTTYLGLRTSGDINDETPNNYNAAYSKFGTAGDDPYLSITYIPALSASFEDESYIVE